MSLTALTTQQWLGEETLHLTSCGEQHKLVPETAAAFLKMQKAAQNDGIDIQIVSSHRDFTRQLSIWNRKWLDELPLYDINDQLLDSASLDEEQKMHAILTWSALPGASRHHWGTDLDVFDKTAVEQSGQKFNLIRSEYLPGGPCFNLASWLEAHAETYGFYLPYKEYNGGVAPEAWHLSFKPIADNIVKQLTLRTLADKLAVTPIQGKETVLANLEEIFSRYTLNGQTL